MGGPSWQTGLLAAQDGSYGSAPGTLAALLAAHEPSASGQEARPVGDRCAEGDGASVFGAPASQQQAFAAAGAGAVLGSALPLPSANLCFDGRTLCQVRWAR